MTLSVGVTAVLNNVISEWVGKDIEGKGYRIYLHGGTKNIV